MAGHSKWANIKHRKAAQDAKKGKAFTKIIKEITVAARLGGGDPSANPRLRSALENARGVNMPKSNIERAIKKGTGELEGVNYEEITYEGYGPGGVAILVETITDNKQRTVAEVRHILSKRGGNMGEPGSVSWIFEKKGVITIGKEAADEDTVMTAALEAGAEDVQDGESVWEVETTPETLSDVKEAMIAEGIEIVSSELSMVPSNSVEVTDEKQARQLMLLMEALEENDDVQNVYSNFDISDELLEKVT
jgi:YebC/PmpR family DNA-binding regulatory protein